MKPHTALARIFRLLLMLLSGCGRAGVPAGPQPGPQAATADTPTVLPSSTPLPAATLPPTETPLPPLDQPLIWYLRGRTPADLPRVNERLNRELAQRGFGAQVELRVLPPGDFDRRVAGAETAGEAFDLVSFTADSCMDAIQMETLLTLNDYRNPATRQYENLFENAAPGLGASFPAAVWKAWAAKGRNVNAIPNQGAWVKPVGVAIRADVVRALTLQEDLDSVHGYADLTSLFAKIQAAIDDGTLQSSDVANAKEIRAVFGAAYILRPEIAGYDPLAMPLVVRWDDSKREVVNWFASGEFKSLAELRRSWQTSGYGSSETLTPDEVTDGYQAGQFVVEVGRAVSGTNSAARYGYDWVEKPLSTAFIPSAAPAASLTGISAKIASQPERVHRAMLLLAWLHTDPKLFNLLAYGIEGEHWQWADRDKGVITLLPSSRYQPDFADQIGDQTLAYAVDTQLADRWKAIREQNAGAPVSAAVGFMFYPRRVAGETAAVKGLIPEWLDPLAHGEVRNIDTYIQRMLKDLDTAGLKAVESELIEQLKADKGPG